MADAFEQAMGRLNEAEQARRAAVRELQQIGAIRTWALVADLGEAVAARYYGVELAPLSTPGYDLVTEDGRKTQVKTLRMTPENQRTSMGRLTEPYDLLLAIRLNEDYSPWYAIEAPRQVMQELYPNNRRTSWTKKLESHKRIRVIAKEELMSPGLGRWTEPRKYEDVYLERLHYPDDTTFLLADGREVSVGEVNKRKAARRARDLATESKDEV